MSHDRSNSPRSAGDVLFQRLYDDARTMDAPSTLDDETPSAAQRPPMRDIDHCKSGALLALILRHVAPLGHNVDPAQVIGLLSAEPGLAE